MHVPNNYLPLPASQMKRIGAVMALSLFLVIGSSWIFAPRTQAAVTAITRVQNQNECSGSTAVSSYSGQFVPLFWSPAVAGHLIVFVVSARGNVGINVPAGYSTAINQSGVPSQAIFYKVAAGGEGSPTATFSSPTIPCISVSEYSGTGLDLPLHAAASTTGSTAGTGSIASGTALTSASNDLFVSGLFMSSTNQASFGAVTNSYNNVANAFGGGSSSTNTSFQFVDCLIAGCGINNNTAVAFTGAGAGAWLGQIAAFFPLTATVNTGTGTNVPITVSAGNLIFTNVTGAGVTTVTSINPTSPTQGTPPAGATYTNTSPAYDISTTATFTGSVNVCVSAAGITNAGTFANLKLLHKEGGVLVDKTTGVNFSTKLVCGSVTSFSPFIVANSSAPTDARGEISGRISAEDGAPLAGVVLKLTGATSATAITDTNGAYHFENVPTTGFYTMTPGRTNYRFSPASRSFSQLGNKTEAVFTGLPNGDGANPLDTPEYFVRQQYLDVLGREPDQMGFNYWSDQILACGGDASCTRAARSRVAAAFFIENEAQQTGSYIYDVYTSALGRKPVFSEYSVDRQQVVGGDRLDAAKTAWAQNFVQRSEFTAKYQNAMTAESFVEALIQSVQLSGLDLSSERANLISLYRQNPNQVSSRAAVIRSLADNSAFKQSQYNRAFVLTEYFSYLRRDIDEGGYDFWVNVLNTGAAGNYVGMVCSFTTSAEYQQRFSSVVTHGNVDCGP